MDKLSRLSSNSKKSAFFIFLPQFAEYVPSHKPRQSFVFETCSVEVRIRIFLTGSLFIQ